MIDIGANLTHKSYKDDLDSVLSSAWKKGVEAIIITGCNLEDSQEALKLSSLDKRLYSTCGIHPHLACDHIHFSHTLFNTIIENDSCCAIGECGLDYHRNYSAPYDQKLVFNTQLEIASKSSLPLFLHQRDAIDDFLSILDSHTLSNEFVTHCFTDNKKILRRLLDRGSYIGVTGWITDSSRNSDLLSAVKYIPDDRLLCETDSPYLLPYNREEKPSVSQRNEPQYLHNVVSALSEARGQSFETIAKICKSNTLRLFSKIEL